MTLVQGAYTRTERLLRGVGYLFMLAVGVFAIVFLSTPNFSGSDFPGTSGVAQADVVAGSPDPTPTGSGDSGGSCGDWCGG